MDNEQLKQKISSSYDAIGALLDMATDRETIVNALYERIETLQEENRSLNEKIFAGTPEDVTGVIPPKKRSITPSGGVVILDPQPVMRLKIREILESAGFRVFGDAASLEEGRRIIDLKTPELVILSPRLDDSDGISALLKLRDTVPNLKAILLTDSKAFTEALEALPLSAVEVMTKPVSRLRLTETATALLA